MRPGAQSGSAIGKAGSFAAEGLGAAGHAAMSPVRAAGQMTKERLSQMKEGTIGAYSSAKQQAQTSAAAAAAGGGGAGPKTGHLALVSGKTSDKSANMKKAQANGSKSNSAQPNSEGKTSSKAATMKKRPSGSERRGVPEKNREQGGAEKNGALGSQGGSSSPASQKSASSGHNPGRLAKMTQAARARSSSGGSVEGAISVSLNMRDEE